ncbi:limulus clotting factor C-like [Phymastichus coffea]|uniref:limulus clotting factor C-like n=1 Tax=Phymastichus coffea TaxID=108790 RepID=UPI00273CA101|nr:limulus clotting factor C-like [Phymastichus coffea]
MMGLRLVALVALCACIRDAVAVRQGKIVDLNRFGENSASCAYHKFRCNTGQCISSVLVCDGRVDCLDGSDETREECSKPGAAQCTARNFRCDYGACVDGDAPCNGVKDCADNSDETLPRCRGASPAGGDAEVQPARCRSGQYECDNRQCIGSTEVCDGNIDCLDRSDETAAVCRSYNCQQVNFRCNYGACIDGDLKCNGVVNCADGSDEDPQLCSNTRPAQTTTTRRPIQRPQQTTKDPYNVDQPRPTKDSGNPWGNRPTQRPPSSQWTQPTRPPVTRPTSSLPQAPFGSSLCSLPKQPQNGHWYLDESQCPNQYKCNLPSNVKDLPPGSILRYECNDGYRLNNTDYKAYCSALGTWSIDPVCEAITCPPLASASRSVECTKRSGDWISCDSQGVPPGTSARLTCRNSYIQDTTDLTTRDDVRCNAEGEWEPKPINCVSVCGIATSGSGTPLIVNGTSTSISEFPWHGTLYRQKNLEKQFICGATVIRDDMLVTAAHCVYDEAKRRIDNANKYFVAVGNIFRDYDYDGNDPRTFRTARVKRIYAQCNYLGLSGNYAMDLAILVIDRPFVFSALLMPICLDTTGVTDQAALEVGNYGRVPGFGRTATGYSSFVLQAITVPYVSQTACKVKSAQAESDRFLTSDKFCAGYTNGSSVCDGDSGGGLVFKTDNKWYLRGIVSVGIGASKQGAVRTCDSHTYSLYTRVSKHMDWIQDVIIKEETKKPYVACP